MLPVLTGSVSLICRQRMKNPDRALRAEMLLDCRVDLLEVEHKTRPVMVLERVQRILAVIAKIKQD